MRQTSTFPPWWELAARARERTAQPVEYGGKTYYSSGDTAERTGWSEAWLRHRVCYIPGENEPVTAPCGLVFIRKPRHNGDMHAPLYFDVDSVPKRTSKAGRHAR